MGDANGGRKRQMQHDGALSSGIPENLATEDVRPLLGEDSTHARMAFLQEVPCLYEWEVLRRAGLHPARRDRPYSTAGRSSVRSSRPLRSASRKRGAHGRTAGSAHRVKDRKSVV